MQHLVRIGTSKLDLYTGDLTYTLVESEIIVQLTERNSLRRDDYLRWIQENNGHRSLTLSDTSKWVLREGNHEHAFVHIHPGRYSAHTIRVKASSLKTAIMTKLFLKDRPEEPIDQKMINHIRRTIGLAPVKHAEACRSILRVLALFGINSRTQ